MAEKKKINLLEVIPCRSEHITAVKEGEEVILSFPRFKRSWMNRYLVPKGDSCTFGRTWNGCLGVDRQ